MIATTIIITWYRAHMPMAEIAALSGMTRQGVWKRLRGAGLLATTIRRAPAQPAICAECGHQFRIARWRINKQQHVFCSSLCYRLWISSPDYHYSRQGQRRARAVVREFFPLAPAQIVHHIDADTTNNTPTNLMVFACHAEHMSWHRGNSAIRPLWRGDKSVYD